MKVVIFDYGAGNLHSLAKAIARTGATVAIEPDPRRMLDGEVLVLPGVGAFTTAARQLDAARDAVREALQRGHPCLGICLGMQLLFDASDEGPGAGLGLVRGQVTRLTSRRVPQIGWNTLDDSCDPRLARAGIHTAWFANSFVCRPDDAATVVAWSTHESDRFPAVVRSGRTLGVQFHPEKSAAPGLALIAAFLADTEAA